MVGCTSKAITDLVAQHDVMAKGPWLTTYTWALTIFCMERCLNLRVVVVAKPVVIAFRLGDIELSEILVTMLTRSLVTQCVYNVAAPGGQSSAARYDRDLPGRVIGVHCTCPFSREDPGAEPGGYSRRRRCA
jgi:hypothetical protein